MVTSEFSLLLYYTYDHYSTCRVWDKTFSSAMPQGTSNELNRLSLEILVYTYSSSKWHRTQTAQTFNLLLKPPPGTNNSQINIVKRKQFYRTLSESWYVASSIQSSGSRISSSGCIGWGHCAWFRLLSGPLAGSYPPRLLCWSRAWTWHGSCLDGDLSSVPDVTKRTQSQPQGITHIQLDWSKILTQKGSQECSSCRSYGREVYSVVLFSCQLK